MRRFKGRPGCGSVRAPRPQPLAMSVAKSVFTAWLLRTTLRHVYFGAGPSLACTKSAGRSHLANAAWTCLAFSAT